MLATRILSLQTVPIQIADHPPVYMDLRDWGSHFWLKGSPWSVSPREEEEQWVFQQFVLPGQCVYDIGANVGMHTALLSSLVGPAGHVYAFEPNPRLEPGLLRTIGGMTNATLFRFALSDQAGEAELFVAEEDHSLTSLANWTGRANTAREVCEMITLDSLAEARGLRRPDFIKCDVEGAELNVFRGAMKILNTIDAPLILFEADANTAKGFGRPISATKDFLADLSEPDYHFFTAENHRLKEVEELDPVHSNVIAIPRASIAPIKDRLGPRVFPS